jgi:hypothetical protein
MFLEQQRNMPMEAFRECFSIIPDPPAMNAEHDLMEILFIALASNLCGGKTCTDMEAFGHAKKDALQESLVGRVI